MAANTPSTRSVLVDRVALAACGKDPVALVEAIRSAATAADLALATD